MKIQFVHLGIFTSSVLLFLSLLIPKTSLATTSLAMHCRGASFQSPPALRGSVDYASEFHDTSIVPTEESYSVQFVDYLPGADAKSIPEQIIPLERVMESVGFRSLELNIRFNNGFTLTRIQMVMNADNRSSKITFVYKITANVASAEAVSTADCANDLNELPNE